MKLSDYDPSNFYNNRKYKAITSNPNGSKLIIDLIL